jgi:hypothetical protein
MMRVVVSTMNASEQITKHIEGLADWRGQVLAQLRKLIHDAAPDVVEEWKWNTPVWSRNGNIVAAGAFQDHVKLNFFKGASLEDPRRLFNAGLEANASRAIDLHESDRIDATGIKDLVRAAVALNSGAPKDRPKAKAQPRTKTKDTPKTETRQKKR